LQVNRIYEAATGGDQVLWLYVLQRAFSSSQGALNAIAYGFTPGVREAINAELVLCIPCLRCRRSPGAAQLSRPDTPSVAAWTGVRGRAAESTYAQSGTTFAAAHNVPPPDISRLHSIGGGSLDEREFEGAIAMSVLKSPSDLATSVVENPFRMAVETSMDR
jgi:hypothetical protein